MDSILLTHSQLAAALAGFACVVAAFQRPLNPVQRHRFLTILLSSWVQMLACLVPVWLATDYEMDPWFWGVVSGIHLGFSVLIWCILVYPLRNLGTDGVIAINKWVTTAVYTLALSTTCVLVANTFHGEQAGFTLYYAALLGGLSIIFLVFADVAIRSN